jgi:hypothetical protein
VIDIVASEAVVDICRRRRKPYNYLLVAVDPRHKDINQEAAARIATITKGDKLAQTMVTRVPYDKAFVAAMGEGKAGQEVDSKLLKPIKSVWDELKGAGEKHRG